jgi:hypothetical protein
MNAHLISDRLIFASVTSVINQSQGLSMTKLFVYGVDQSLSNVEIQAEFEKFGMVTDVYNSGSVLNPIEKYSIWRLGGCIQQSLKAKTDQICAPLSNPLHQSFKILNNRPLMLPVLWTNLSNFGSKFIFRKVPYPDPSFKKFGH